MIFFIIVICFVSLIMYKVSKRNFEYDQYLEMDMDIKREKKKNEYLKNLIY